MVARGPRGVALRPRVGGGLESLRNGREAEKSLVIVFFETEDDYRHGDDALNAMPAGDTPGQRPPVAKYQVAFRMKE